jgi:hypothetical protein
MAQQQSQIYTGCYVTSDGALLAEAASIKINKNPDLKVVATLAKGFAGVNLGVKQCEITVECAIPSADFEFNPDPFMEKGKEVELGVVMANRQMQGKFFINGGNYEADVTKPANLTISYIGPFVPWE